MGFVGELIEITRRHDVMQSANLIKAMGSLL